MEIFGVNTTIIMLILKSYCSIVHIEDEKSIILLVLIYKKYKTIRIIKNIKSPENSYFINKYRKFSIFNSK